MVFLLWFVLVVVAVITAASSCPGGASPACDGTGQRVDAAYDVANNVSGGFPGEPAVGWPGDLGAVAHLPVGSPRAA